MIHLGGGVSNVLGSYELLELIGHGATGRVWRARHLDSGRDVAMKVLRDELADDAEVRERFLNEGVLLAEHPVPGAVAIHETVFDDHRVGLVMDLVVGPDLRQVILAAAPVPPARACALMGQVAETLSRAHGMGLVHRDVKPENILVAATDSGAGEALLTDFGLARVLDETTTSRTRSHVFGTPHYVSPEALKGRRAGREADVYALGVMLFELVTGWRPFRSTHPAGLIQQHLEVEPVRPTGMPDEVWDLVAQCLAKDAKVRPSAAQVAERLVSISVALSGAPALPRTDPPTEQEKTQLRAPAHPAPQPGFGAAATRLVRRRSTQVATATAGALAVAAVIYGVTGSGAPGPVAAGAVSDRGTRPTATSSGAPSADPSIDIEASPSGQASPSSAGTATAQPSRSASDSASTDPPSDSGGARDAPAFSAGPDDSAAPSTGTGQPDGPAPAPPSPTERPRATEPTRTARPTPTPSVTKPSTQRAGCPGADCDGKSPWDARSGDCGSKSRQRIGSAQVRTSSEKLMATLVLYRSTVCKTVWAELDIAPGEDRMIDMYLYVNGANINGTDDVQDVVPHANTFMASEAPNRCIKAQATVYWTPPEAGHWKPVYVETNCR